MIGTTDGFRAFAIDRGIEAVSGATDADLSAALVRAEDYLRAHYPRAVTAGGDALDLAAYHVAVAELEAPRSLSRTYAPGERKVLVEVQGVKWQALPDGSGRSWPVLTVVDGLLGGSTGVPSIMVV